MKNAYWMFTFPIIGIMLTGQCSGYTRLSQKLQLETSSRTFADAHLKSNVVIESSKEVVIAPQRVVTTRNNTDSKEYKVLSTSIYRSVRYVILTVSITCMAFSLAWLLTWSNNGGNFVWQETELRALSTSERFLIVSGLSLSMTLVFVGCGVMVISIFELKYSYGEINYMLNSTVSDLFDFKNKMLEVLSSWKAFIHDANAAHYLVCLDTLTRSAQSFKRVVNEYGSPIKTFVNDTKRILVSLKEVSSNVTGNEAELNLSKSSFDRGVEEFRTRLKSFFADMAEPSRHLVEIRDRIIGLTPPVYRPLNEIFYEVTRRVSTSAENLDTVLVKISEEVGKFGASPPMLYHENAMSSLKPTLIREHINKFDHFLLQYFKYINKVFSYTGNVTKWTETNDFYYEIITPIIISSALLPFLLVISLCAGALLGVAGTKCFENCSPRGYVANHISDRGAKIMASSVNVSSYSLWLLWTLMFANFIVADVTLESCESSDPSILLLFTPVSEIKAVKHRDQMAGKFVVLSPCGQVKDFFLEVGSIEAFTINESFVNVRFKAVARYSTALLKRSLEKAATELEVSRWANIPDEAINESSIVLNEFQAHGMEVEQYLANLAAYTVALDKLFVKDLGRALADHNVTSANLASLERVKELYRNLTDSICRFTSELGRIPDASRKFELVLRNMVLYQEAAAVFATNFTSGMYDDLRGIIDDEIARCAKMFYDHLDHVFSLLRGNREACVDLTSASLKAKIFTCRSLLSALQSAWLGQCVTATFLLFAVIFSTAAQEMFKVPAENIEDTGSLARYIELS